MYFQRYDEAEAVYREIDRKDLAVQSRRRVGDYVRVVQVSYTHASMLIYLHAHPYTHRERARE